jgi:hypothetical protein
MLERRSRTDEDGSIAMAAIVILISTALVLALIAVVDQGMRASRRAGDSANALQVADAGINAAVQYIPTVPSSARSVGPISGTVGGGSYTYSATWVNKRTWNVTATGKDKAGLERRVVAQAVAEPVFARPLYIKANSTFQSGMTLDSYSDRNNRCTKKGILTINEPETMSFGGNSGANCQGAAWGYSIDGCEFPGEEADLTKPLPTRQDSTLSPKEEVIGPSKCPGAPYSRRTSPRTFPLDVGAPTNPPADVVDASGTLTCDPTRPLQWGRSYYYGTVNLLDGCYITGIPLTPSNPSGGSVADAIEDPVEIYSRNINIGVDNSSNSGPSSTGAGNVINAPQSGYCAEAYTNPNQQPYPISGYCAKWVHLLRLNVIGDGTVTIRKQARFFWGLIYAPGGKVLFTASALEAWGASVGSTMGTGSQFIWHYDDSLEQEVGSGRFLVANWREEGTAVP